MDNRQDGKKQFKAISKADFDNMDPQTKDAAIRSRHLGIIRSSEEIISNQLKIALGTPREVNGDILPPLKHEDLVVVLIHREDPILSAEELEPMRDNWEQQNIEVGMFISGRTEFAAGISAWKPREDPPNSKNRPYRKVGKLLMQPPPKGCVYVAVFDMGMSTVLFIGFDPNNPGVETVAADPNTPPPPAVEPLERVEPKAELEQGGTG